MNGPLNAVLVHRDGSSRTVPQQSCRSVPFDPVKLRAGWRCGSMSVCPPYGGAASQPSRKRPESAPRPFLGVLSPKVKFDAEGWE